MKTALFLLPVILSGFLSGCATTPPSPAPNFAGWYNNACLPEAAAMAEGLKKSDIKADVLIINTPKWSHAVTVYMYPTGANTLWAWDSNWKSTVIRAYWGDSAGQARAWIAKCGQGETMVSSLLLNQDL